MDSRYGDHFPEYAKYLGIPLMLNESMYGTTNSGELFADELTNCLIDEASFNQSKFKISVNYKYVPDNYKLSLLSYVDDCVY